MSTSSLATDLSRRVKAAAIGRWLEILPALASSLAPACSIAGSTKHVPCPVHGGENGDAFRMHKDAANSGGCVCNTCNGPEGLTNGLLTLAWVNNWSYERSVEEVAKYLRIDVDRLNNQWRGHTRSDKQSIPPAAAPTTENGTGNVQHNGSTNKTRPIAGEIPNDETTRKNREKLNAVYAETIADNGKILAYLNARGIPMKSCPPAIKLHTSLPYWEDDLTTKQKVMRGRFPAIVAQVINPAPAPHGTFVAVHITYLDQDEPRKASISVAKKVSYIAWSGCTSGGAIQLFPVVKSKPLAIAEGIETALAIYSATGAAVWSAISAGNFKHLQIPPEVTQVEIWADPGDAGAKAAENLRSRLLQEGRRVAVISLTPDHIASGCTDWLDVLKSTEANHGKEALVSARRLAIWEGKAPDVERTPITVRTDEAEVIRETVAAITNHGEIYQRAGMLVSVVRDSRPIDPNSDFRRASGSPTITPISKPQLREILSDKCRFVSKRVTAEGEILNPIHTPRWLVECIHERQNWPQIRYLDSISETPIFTPSGAIYAEPGYHAPTGILFEPSTEVEFPSVPDSPALSDAQAAANTILETVIDFPFVDESHRSAWLAALLTPLARHAFSGPAPLFLADANVRGAGKSLLCDLIGLIVSGREMSRMTNTTDDEEMGKRITSVVMAGDPLVLIDNIRGSFGGQNLDALLTGSRWKARILGTNTVPSFDLRTVWYATGNNVQVSGDMVRRTIHIRLESHDERPETRSGFHHGDIRAWARENRGRLVSAALTILRAFHVAGRPQVDRLGSFEGWSSLVRSVIVWLGFPDPVQTQINLEQSADNEHKGLAVILDSWESIDPVGNGLTSSEICRKLNEEIPQGYIDPYSEIREAIADFCQLRNGKFDARVLGNNFRKIQKRWIGNKFLMSTTDRKNVAKWMVKIGNVGISEAKAFNESLQGLHGDAGSFPTQEEFEVGTTIVIDSNKNIYEPEKTLQDPADPACVQNTSSYSELV